MVVAQGYRNGPLTLGEIRALFGHKTRLSTTWTKQSSKPDRGRGSHRTDCSAFRRPVLSPTKHHGPMKSLFGGRSVACDFVDLVQNGFCIRPVAHQRHDLAGLGPRYRGSFERHFAASTTVSRLNINPPNRL